MDRRRPAGNDRAAGTMLPARAPAAHIGDDGEMS
jgi:hypothetical protein